MVLDLMLGVVTEVCPRRLRIPDYGAFRIAYTGERLCLFSLRSWAPFRSCEGNSK